MSEPSSTPPTAHRRLTHSCILLFILYFLLEASYFLAPAGASFQGPGSIARYGYTNPWYSFPLFLVVLFISQPAQYATPIIAVLQGLWYARNTQLREPAIYKRLLAIASACALIVVFVCMQGFWNPDGFGLLIIIALAAVPVIAFLIGALLMRAIRWLITRFNTRHHT